MDTRSSDCKTRKLRSFETMDLIIRLTMLVNAITVNVLYGDSEADGVPVAFSKIKPGSFEGFHENRDMSGKNGSFVR